MLTFTEAEALYQEIDSTPYRSLTPRLRRSKKNFDLFKRQWDNTSRGLASDHYSLIKRIHDTFFLRTFRVLGDFKDLAGQSHAAIYDTWVATLTQEWEGATHESFLALCKDVCKEQHGMTDYDTEEGASLMLYRSGIGMVLEDKAIRALRAAYASHPYVMVEAAPASLETRDVDALVLMRDSREVVLKISIKCLYALTDKFIDEQYRGQKGKTEPELYVGYKSLTGKLQWFWRGCSPEEVRARIEALSQAS